MSWLRRRTPMEWLTVAVVLLSATCCLLAVKGGVGRGDSVAVAAISDDPAPITNVRLYATVRPTRVQAGQEVKIAAQVAITGGPGPVTFAAKIPGQDGRTYEGSVTTMVDRNGVYGFQLPPVKADMDPGTYVFSFKAFSGLVASTRTVVLTVEPPEVFLP